MGEEAVVNSSTRKTDNKNKVIGHALSCFVEKGIESAKISEIAKRAGLTERSVFRYFDTKADLVLETALLFWQEAMARADTLCRCSQQDGLCGADQIALVLQGYAALYFTSRQELIFVHEAEAYLNRHGKALLVKNRPPVPFKESTGPLSAAIRQGLQDGSVAPELDLEALYDNTYDALLGLIQKMAISDGWNGADEFPQRRLSHFCRMLADAYRKT